MEMYSHYSDNRRIFRWCFIDIDGTLLNSKGELTYNSKYTIKSLSDIGVNIVLASARMPNSISNIQSQLGIVSDIICYNGAIIKDKKGTVLVDHTILREAVQYIIQLQVNIGGTISFFFFFSNDNWYVIEKNIYIKYEENLIGIQATLVDRRYIQELLDNRININKILVLGDNNLLKKIFFELTNAFPLLKCEFSKDEYLEITHHNASKKSAVQFLCNKYKIDKNKIIAIGDGYNDLSMIKYAGIGVTMGNAPNEVKNESDYIIGSNDDDGVSDFICKFYGI